MKIIFANIIQGMIHCGYDEKKENVFAGYHPEKYIEYFVSQQPDILCLAECLFDNNQGESSFVEELKKKCHLLYSHNLVGEKAFFVQDKFYGLSICSKFPFTSYEVEKLANPKIETIRPNGDYWIMHDKYIQKARLQVEKNKFLNIANTHMFPFQHFNKHFWDTEFSSYRNQWAKMLMPKPEKSLIVGDFNTVDISIDKAFPELQIGKKVYSLISYDGKKYQPKYLYNTQIEYMLATPDIKLIFAREEMVYSDQPFLIAEIES